ncbi:MAG: penicillin-binding protein 1C [Prevotellaceae bacterium]|jgi:penicillin-binding protein 1C|nr:penicillin-binding protein 1C [Prevotellaceae bacterium]
MGVGGKVRKVVALLLILFLIFFYFSLPRTLFCAPYATVVTDRDGELLGARIADDGQWRFPVSERVPEKFIICLLQFEDRHFYRHFGVNPGALVRALIQNVRQGKVVSGGSTITMQTIRLYRREKQHIAPARSFFEKCIEMFLAVRMECRYSKKSILALYASHAPFGGNVVGLEAASWRYFGHPSAQLSWAEAATLAVLPNAPSMLHLSRNRDALLRKRNRLLKSLFEKQKIETSTYQLAIEEPLPSEPLPLPQVAPHLVSYYHQTQRGTYSVSTIDKKLQIRVENLLERWSNELLGSDIKNVAAIVWDIQAASPIVYCGNVRFDDQSSGNQVDIIRAPRSTGSILKPFLYCALLQEGTILPHTLIPDIPLNINGFTPKNFNLQHDGAVPASEALARSLNVPAVNMLQMYGQPKFYDLLKNLGIRTLDKPSSHYGLSIILGGAEGTLYDISRVYCSMAKMLLQDSLPFHSNRLPFKPAAIWQTFEALKEVNRPEEIDWRSVPSMQRIAWKTGTSWGFRDAWAIGVTPKYVVGVWVGNANGEGKPGLTGAKTAGPIMFEIFSALPSSSWFQRDKELVEAHVCRLSGHLASRFCPQVDTLLVAPEGLNSDPCPFHIPVLLTPDERYRVYSDNAEVNAVQKSWFVLPPVWAWYYKQRHPLYRPLPPYLSGSASHSEIPMQFIYPQSGMIITLPKQLDGSRGSLTIRLAHNDPKVTIYWHLDEDYLCSTTDFHEVILSPPAGAHTLSVVDNFGQISSVSFTINE